MLAENSCNYAELREFLSKKGGMISMNKFLKILITAAALGAGNLAAANNSIEAAGNIWAVEEGAIPVTSYKRIIIMPMENATAAQSALQNSILQERASKRLKKTKFENMSAMATATEKEALLASLQAGDAYLVPRLHKLKKYTEKSPATWVNVEKVSYDNIENGPHGSAYRLHYWSAYEPYLIPEHYNPRLDIDIDYTLYDGITKQPVMTLADYYTSGNTDEKDAFETITKNFTGDWSRLKKDRRKNYKTNLTIGFKPLNCTAEIASNEMAVRTLEFALRDEAANRLKNLRPVFTNDAVCDYYVTGEVTKYACEKTWIAPTVSTEMDEDYSEEFSWYDKNDKEHIGYRRHYRTKITDCFGYTKQSYQVALSLQLIDAKTGEVIATKYKTAGDDKRYANAVRDILKDFYRDVDQKIK